MAVGRIGLSYDDFCGLTPGEFGHIYKAYDEERAWQYRDNWERARLVAAHCVLPYSKKGATIHTICPLPWDAGSRPMRKAEAEHVSKEEALRRFEEMSKKAENG